jgi:uncharacterized protein YkwD
MASPWNFLKRARRIGTKGRLSRNEEEIADLRIGTSTVKISGQSEKMMDFFKSLAKITRISGIFDKIGTVGKQLALGVTVSLAVCCSPPTVPAEPGVALVARDPSPAPEIPVHVQRGGLEGRVVAEINSFRARHGRAPFRQNSILQRLEAAHSEEMARRQKMSHAGFPKRAERAGRSGLVWTAENVMWGYGYAEATLAETIVKSWINSGGHCKNLLRENTEIGVGLARGAHGSIWATQLSARRK